VYRHDYQDVDAKNIWDTVKNELDDLRRVLEAELNPPG
jgi:uncharacterized protein with HEPN domain